MARDFVAPDAAPAAIHDNRKASKACGRSQRALSKAFFSVLVALAVALVGAPTHAAGKKPKDKAGQLFDEGDKLYKQGQFAEAADRFSRAYEIDPEPTLLYNLARAYENMGELEKASQTY